MGQGRIPNVIHVVHGFASNIKLDSCYTRAIYIGECYNALRGVRVVASNANVIYGKIGGQFSESQIDPSTCEVGVTFDASSNTNEVMANIEYCRRTANSRPFVDDGSTNKFYGYIESCSLQGLVNGDNSRYQIKNGGSNVYTDFGYELYGNQSSIELLDSVVENGVPVGTGNSTIVYNKLQACMSKSSQSEVISRGSKEILPVGRATQYVINSNDLATASWSLSLGGEASADDLTISSSLLNEGNSNRYRYGTKIIASKAASSPNDYYNITQNLTATFTADISFGIALRVISGDVDFFLKIQSTTGNIQYSKAFRLTGSGKITEHFHSIPTQYVDSDTYSVQLQIRTWKPSDIEIFNIHLCNAANIESAPASVGLDAIMFQPVSKNSTGYKPYQVCSIKAPLTLK